MTILHVDRDTVFKLRAVQSTELPTNEKVSVPQGTLLELESCQLNGEHYLVVLKEAIAPVGKVGFFYFRHVHIEGAVLGDSARNLVNLVLSDRWGELKREAVSIVGSSENTCVAFASAALRAIGIQVPNSMTVTKPFKEYLESDVNCVSVNNANDLMPGDLCFTEDHASFPTYPAHVYIFIEWRDLDSTADAMVVDNQGEIHLRNVTRRGPRTPFRFALRLP